jgi:hypothetical protein
MDFKNKSIPLEMVTSTDVNKTIQRSTTKALALHGVGLNVYAGEDLPMIPELYSVEVVAGWMKNGKTIGECMDYIRSQGCSFTDEYVNAVKEAGTNGISQ